MSEVVEVTGGSAGIAASYDAARALADAFAQAADRLGGLSLEALELMRDPRLLASGLLSPGTLATAEAGVLAVAGAETAAALAWAGAAVAVRTAVAGLQAADHAVRTAVGTLDHQLALVALAQLVGPVVVDPDLLTEHPGLTEHLVNGLGGPLTAALAGAAYGAAGRPLVAPYAAELPTRRPRDLRDLLEHLHAVADLSPTADSPGNGTVEVQTVRDERGVRHVVYLPGTDDFNAPWVTDGDVRDLESDLDLATRQPDAYRAGVVEAMRRAGIGPDEPVLVVGHSLGGMAAAALAAGGSGFRVTGAVTAGAPTAQVAGYPAGTHVLSLEQRGDVVPELDGAPNRDTVEQTTVTFDAEPDGGVLAHHGYEAYEDGAALADGSTHPSVVDAVAALHAHGHLGEGGEVTSQVFQITRAP